MLQLIKDRKFILSILVVLIILCLSLLYFIAKSSTYKKTYTFSTDDFISFTIDKKIEYISYISNKSDMNTVWKSIVDTYKTHPSSESHDIAHYVGYLIYQNNKDKGLSICTSEFAFGCYHGFFEAAFEKDLNDINLYGNKCELAGEINSGPWSSCIHGIGHGVATFFNSTNLQDALSLCDQLNAGNHYCHDGVFMEFAISSTDTEFTNYDFVKICENIDPRYTKGCARNIILVMTSKQNKNIQEVISSCSQSGNLEVKNTCADSVGLSLIQYYQADYNKIFNTCNLYSNVDLISICVSAAAGEYVFQDFPDWKLISSSLCDLLKHNQNVSCKLRVENLARSYNRN